jgi:hypothetical protein
MTEGRRPNQERAHDVLAAEAFALPAADPALRHAPVVLPDDPSGIAEPHDILAAEEFAMPADVGAGRDPARGPSRWAWLGAAAAALALLGLARRRHN